MEPALFTKMPGLPMDVLAYCCKVERRLLIKPSLSAPPETNYLVTEYGDPITFGGVRILVG